MKNNILIRLSLIWVLTFNCVYSTEEEVGELAKEAISFFKEEYPSSKQYFPNDKVLYCVLDLNEDGTKEVLLSQKGEHGYGRHNLFFILTKKKEKWHPAFITDMNGEKDESVLPLGLDEFYRIKDSKTKKTYYACLGTPLEKGNETYLIKINEKGLLVRQKILLESFIRSIENPVFEKIEIKEEK